MLTLNTEHKDKLSFQFYSTLMDIRDDMSNQPDSVTLTLNTSKPIDEVLLTDPDEPDLYEAKEIEQEIDANTNPFQLDFINVVLK